MLRRTDSETFSFTQQVDLRKESAYNFNAPDYLIDLTDMVRQHPDADLMVDPGELPARPVRRRTATTRPTRRGGCSPTTGPTSTTTAGCGPTRTATASSTHADRRRARTSTASSTSTSPSRRSSRASTCGFMYHRAGANALHGRSSAIPAQRMADGIFLGFQHIDQERGDPGDRLHGPDRLLQERRLVVGDHAGDGDRLVHRDDQRPGRHAVRHVLRARSCSPRQRLDGRPGRRGRRRDGDAGRGRQRSPARSRSAATASPTRRRDLALQQRLGLRRERLDVAGRVG